MDKGFVEEITGLLGESEGCKLIEALGTEPSVSVRVNLAKCGLPSGRRKVAWCGNGLYLDNRPAFTFDPLLHAGAYYVQDASSMFICHVLRQIAGDNPVAYLDLCAAPGGKTTAALDVLDSGSLVVANEIDRQRAQVLRENVIKWGRTNCVVTNDSPQKFGRLKSFFDIIAADMPCSGEGMFRKDDEAVRQWSPSLVRQCAARQREIADSVWDALKPGGYMVYSTCTFNRQENEENVDYLIHKYGAEPVRIEIAPGWNISGGVGTTAHCYRFMPHRTEGEGLFVAVLRKPGQYQGCHVKIAKEKNIPVPKPCRAFVKENTGIELSVDGGMVVARPAGLSRQIMAIRRNTNAILSGVPVATIKGKDVVPEHAIALSTVFNKESFNVLDVGYSQAIAFLRGEALTVDSAVPRGYCLVSYGGYPLGWLKNVGNRTNNCYPKEWRIRAQTAPDAPPVVLL